MNLASPGQAGGALFRSNPLQPPLHPSASPSSVAAFNQREVAVIDAAHFKAGRWTGRRTGGKAGGAGTFNLLKNL